MRILSKIGACLLIAALSTIARAAGDSPPAVRPLSPKALNAFLDALNTNRDNPLFKGGQVDCTFDVECPVTLTPQEFFDGKQQLIGCAIQVGNISLTVPSHPIPGAQRTVIHWTIGPVVPHTPPTNATYTFQIPPTGGGNPIGVGLVILQDDNNATAKKADSVTPTDLKVTFKYMKHNNFVTYYPLVFQTIGTNDPTLCGAADPQIVNN